MQLHHLFDRKEWSWTWISWGGDEAGCQRWKVAQKEWYVFFSGNNVILMSIDCAQETWYLCILLFAARLAQWWERSPPTSVARVRFPDPASYVGWVCYWFSSLPWGFFFGSPFFLLPQKSSLLNSNSISKQWKKSHFNEMSLQIPIYFIIFILFRSVMRHSWPSSTNIVSGIHTLRAERARSSCQMPPCLTTVSD